MRGAILVLFVAAACGGSRASAPAQPQPISHTATNADPPPPAPAAATDPHSIAGAILKMDALEARMCACVDAPCAQRVADEMTTWGHEMALPENKLPKPTDVQLQKMNEIVTGMTDCMTKAMGAGSGSSSGNGP